MNATLVRCCSILTLAASLVTTAFSADAPKVQFPRPSPTATLKQRIGLTDFEITYSRPGVKGRDVFKVLAPYGDVWRTGANEATKIKFSEAITFGGTEVPAGEYALFTIPGNAEWTVILNKASGDWGAYKYDAKNDVLRVKAKAVKLSEPVESFTIDFDDLRDDSAALNLSWATTRVPVKIHLNTIAVVTGQIDAALAAEKKPAGNFYDSAAMFYLNNNLDLAKAAQWENTAIEAKPSFSGYYHLALILAKKGDKAGALAAAKKSLELVNGASKDEYTRLNNAVIESLGK